MRRNLKTEHMISYRLELVLFDLYFTIMLLIKGFGMTDGTIYRMGVVLSFAFVFGKILIGKYNPIQKVGIFLLILLSFICWYSSRDLGLPICIALVLSMKDVSIKHAFRVGSIVWTVAFTVLIITQMLNLFPRDFVIHSKYGLGYVIRWALGYSHPNVLQIAYTVIVFYLFYGLRHDDQKQIVHDHNFRNALLFSLVGAIYIFLYSFSTTGLLMYLIFIVILCLLEIKRRAGRKRNYLENCILFLAFPVCIFLSVLGPLILTGRAFDIVNKIVNTRLSLSRTYLTEFGITLFGRDFSFMPARITLDCSYMYLLMHDGVIAFGIMTIGYLLLMRDTIKAMSSFENSVEIAILISVAFAAMSEPFAFNTSFKNVTLLFLGSDLYRRTSKMGKERAWLPIFSRLAEKYIYLPDASKIGTALRTLIEIIRNQYRKAIVVGVVTVLIGEIAFACLYREPKEFLARRISCDTDESSVSLFYSQKEINDLETQPGIVVLNYKDESDPMLSFQEGNIFLLERIRGEVSSCLWAVAVAVFLFSLQQYRKETSQIQTLK
jgi:hypothetical protein